MKRKIVLCGALFFLIITNILGETAGTAQKAAAIAIDKAIVAGSDDADQIISTGVTNISRAIIDLGALSDSVGSLTLQLVGLRFLDIWVPTQTTVTNTYIQFASDAFYPGSTSPCTLLIRAEALIAPNYEGPKTFSATANNIRSRPLTTGSVTWIIPNAWGKDEKSANEKTPDLSPLVQELVNSGHWVSGLPICFIFSPVGSTKAWRRFVSYDCPGAPDKPAKLHLEYCLQTTISAQPRDTNIVAGQTVRFSVAASGATPLTYQWQVSADNGGSWSNVMANGATTVYNFTAASADNEKRFRCQVSNPCNASVASNTAILSVCTPPSISVQPPDYEINIGDTAFFSVTATGSSLAYQWQRSNDTGRTWNALSGETGATVRFFSRAEDIGAMFRCIVSNGCGTSFSNDASLKLCVAPAITSQPRDTNAIAGQSVSFGVTCSGINLAFQWQHSADGATWGDIAGKTSATFTIAATSTDNGAKFRCHIKNRCDDLYSHVVLMPVCTPVTIKETSITARNVVAGNSVGFSVTAEGTNVTFQWQKSVSGSATFADIADARASLYSFFAQKSDSGCSYRCVVAGQCSAPVNTVSGLVKAYEPAWAAFFSDSVGQAPYTVGFFDSSKGNFTKRVWDFGDGQFDSTAKNPTHSYATAGAFTAKLTISGPGGTSVAEKKIFTYNPGQNPIQLSGAYLTPEKALITFKNYEVITSPVSFVTPDSIGLWRKAGVMPLTPETGIAVKTYSFATLKAKGAQYVDTVSVPALTGTDSIYWFMNAIFWSDGKKSAFAQGNGAGVLMRDTMPINNDVAISGTYIPDDTVRVSLANVASIDTARVDSVGVWYGIGNEPVDFNNPGATMWAPARRVFDAAGGRYDFSIINTQFNNEEKAMRVAVIQLGKNDRRSPIRAASFPVGKLRPINPVRLTAKTLSATQIRLSWDPIAPAFAERMVIRYRSGQAIPKTYDLSALKLDSLAPAVTDTAIIGNNFGEKTRYYFGAQVFRNGLWSVVADSACASDSTPEAGPKLASNSAAITKLVFDTTVNEIKVYWSVDPAQADSLQVGILYATDTFPTINTNEQQALAALSTEGSAYVKLRENLLFNTTYFVSLWLRRSSGKWTAPTAAGMRSVKTPAFSWQSVVFFSKENDSVYAFNRETRLINQPADRNVTHTTLLSFTPDKSSLDGFVPVSMGLEFRDKNDLGFPFNIGLKINSLPKGYSYADVRIYRPTQKGLWLFDENPQTIDSATRYCSVLTNQLDYPFIAMIDTLPPQIRVLSRIKDAVRSGEPVSDTVELIDNVANTRWWFRCARGGDEFKSGDVSQFGTLDMPSKTLTVTIPANLVSPDNGVRGQFTATDGHSIDTADLSRRVLRDSSEILFTNAMKWLPISAAVVLDTTDPKIILTAFTVGGEEWKYDNTKFRLFKWQATSANAGNDDKWIEYSQQPSAFEFVRGNLLWIKSREDMRVRLGRGATPSLKATEPFTIEIPAKEWIDFGLPYKFDVVVGDIMAATAENLKKVSVNITYADSLQFYTWQRDATGGYRAEGLYIAGISDSKVNDNTTSLMAGNFQGYTVYNPTSESITLTIPPTPQAMSTIGGLSRRKSVNEGWSVKVISSLDDGSILSTVYCGYTQERSVRETYYPSAPSMKKISAGVYDELSMRFFGHAIAHAMDNGGCSFLLSFRNSSPEAQTIRYRLEPTATMPSTLHSAIYNEATGVTEDLSKGEATIVLDGNSQTYRRLFVGTNEYLAKASMQIRPMRLLLQSLYPNPCRSRLHIRYTLPYQGVDKVRFSLFDVRGKRVWQRELGKTARAGRNELIWNGTTNDGRRVGSGVYLLRMAAFGPKGALAGTFEQRVTFLP
jgi:PKD repeat protein